MSPPKPSQPDPVVEASDADLFGSIWPLGDSVKLDPTVDRQQLRAQTHRLGELGYALDFKLQIWSRPQL
jgi:hypothetical protein